ncbi:MAG: type II secretion system protein [Deltaproteobacteria bacterium]|nr:type II secretion system protein [Deltaproteobacteria bacterium]
MKEKGFTLIELLVTIAVLGILAVFAIPQMAAYRTRAFNARAESDLRNLITAEEAYWVDYQTYTTITSALPGFKASADVTVQVTAATTTFFRAWAKHTYGDRTYWFNTIIGKIH